MIRRPTPLAVALTLLLAVAPITPHVAAAQEQGAAEPAASEPAKSEPAKSGPARPATGKPDDARGGAPGLLSLLPADAVTEHTLQSDTGAVPYTATAGTLSLFGQTGERSAAMFYTAYVAKDAVKDAAAGRPLTFVFNGGPGAASAYLHLGLVGPRILDFGPSGRDGANARLVDNPQSWLAFTDLVVIDPIGTGWSRAAKADDAGNFYGVQSDAQAMAKAIALYVTRNNRGNSPKYLLGESYGGYRAAKTAQVLRQDQGIVVAGIVMLSPLIEGPLIFNASRFPLGAALQLPSLAAAELERRNAFTPEAIRDAEHFALSDYLTALAGPPLPDAAARAFYARVAQLTGLPLDTVTRTRGFVRDAYVKQLRERDQAVVSQYDATLAAPDPYPESVEDRGPDPVLSGFTRAYGGAMSAYARNELGFRTEMTYVLLADDINGKWQWGKTGKGSVMQASASDDIRELLSVAPSFRLLIAQGYTDLVTPYGVSKYVVDHLPPSLAAGRVALKLYRGGHMLYTVPASRAAFTADAKTFYAAPAGATTGKN